MDDNEEDSPSTPTLVENSDDEGKRPASPVEPEIGMWVDQSKRIFLWYYHIYLVTRDSKGSADVGDCGQGA